MIISDIFSRVGIVAGDVLEIPSIIYIALPWSFVNRVGWIENPSWEKSSNCCGCICFYRNWMVEAIRETAWYSMKNNKLAMKTLMTYTRRPIIETSFFGLEPGQCVPPNVTFTGPLSDEPSDLLPVLR
jgi:UDP:flavonoid glycosyltransferase YjiC (YdhE family)